MKIKTLLVAAAMMATANVWAQSPEPFLTDETRPDGRGWILPPPSTTGGEFANDFYYYQWGKEQREEEWVSEWALWDEGTDLSHVFGASMDIPLTHETTPEILKLAESATSDAHLANKAVKNFYQRKRPFATFNEPSLKPEEDEEEATTFSYPSGHSSRGWMYALTLATVAPECTEELMLRARIYALHRVVCGHHWKSDIDASLMLTAGIFANVVVTEAYQEQLKKAREEYQRIKNGESTPAEAPAANEAKERTPIYDMQGRVLNGEPTSKGVYIQDGVKFAK
ncbi:MAG: phosphatase PAP2 family protein [Bacteroidaceae bacterium]|nr:phosphatase PAP2 family protein [Bacteroidaceae bacterium]